MHQIWKSFRALYFASLMMLIGSGLLSTYLALRLAADNVDGLWIGALMAANYFGLVLGGKIGHRLIARVGHIRAYATCAGIVGAAVLCHGLTDWLPIWLLLRVIVGLGMMCQYMVIESWLNEQAEARQRGVVFSLYMIASYLGLVLGQLILAVHPQLGLELLMVVACGWYNGYTLMSIMIDLGLVTKKQQKLTRKGQLVVWCAYGKEVTV